MNKDLKKLKIIGAQKIHEDTHIPLSYVQSVIHASFEGLTKIQFLGFISILEREYDIDLSTLKAKGTSYFEEEEPASPKVFVVTEKKRNFTGLYVFVVLLIFSLAIYATFEYKKEKVTAEPLNNHAIIDAQKKISVKDEAIATVNPLEENLTKELNTSEEVNSSIKNSFKQEKKDKVSSLQPIVVKEEVIVPKKEGHKKVHSFVIKPRSRVWIGYINLTDKKKRQAIVKHSLTLDASKKWLIAAGHGNVNIVLDGKLKRYSASKSVRYLYENGSLKKLSITEFKRLNNGRLW